jgi:flagellar biosynthesis protein FlhF
MIIKKFAAPTMTEALSQVRNELGTDAIILSTRTERKGHVFDFRGRSVVEVTAALDDSALKGNGSGRKKRIHSRSSSISPAEARVYPPETSGVYEPPKHDGGSDVRDIGNHIKLEQIIQDIKEIRHSIKVLADSIIVGDMGGLPRNCAHLLTKMRTSGMDETLSKRIIHQLLDELNGAELSNSQIIVEKASHLLVTSFPEVLPVIFRGVQPTMVAFVGPTGSGKTTTIAKIGTEFALQKGKKVALLTIDTKRVNALGQLKAYCRIINIPLYISYTTDDLKGIMPRLQENEVVLIDTPGTGPLDKAQLDIIDKFFQYICPQETHLVMGISLSQHEMKQVFNCFKTLNPNRLLFTKLDETETYGQILSFAISSQVPLSYVTYGQNVPGDYSLANPREIVHHCLGTTKVNHYHIPEMAGKSI